MALTLARPVNTTAGVKGDLAWAKGWHVLPLSCSLPSCKRLWPQGESSHPQLSCDLFASRGRILTLTAPCWLQGRRNAGLAPPGRRAALLFQPLRLLDTRELVQLDAHAVRAERKRLLDGRGRVCGLLVVRGTLSAVLASLVARIAAVSVGKLAL